MNDSNQFPIQPMNPEEVQIIEKVYKTYRSLLIFFSVFQMIWIAMFVFGMIYNILALIICGGIFFVLYILIIGYYIRLCKYLRSDLDERTKIIITGTVALKRITPARTNKFYIIRVNDKNYRVPRQFYEKTDTGSTVEFPVSKNTRFILL